MSGVGGRRNQRRLLNFYALDAGCCCFSLSEAAFLRSTVSTRVAGISEHLPDGSHHAFDDHTQTRTFSPSPDALRRRRNVRSNCTIVDDSFVDAQPVRASRRFDQIPFARKHFDCRKTECRASRSLRRARLTESLRRSQG